MRRHKNITVRLRRTSPTAHQCRPPTLHTPYLLPHSPGLAMCPPQRRSSASDRSDCDLRGPDGDDRWRPAWRKLSTAFVLCAPVLCVFWALGTCGLCGKCVGGWGLLGELWGCHLSNGECYAMILCLWVIRCSFTMKKILTVHRRINGTLCE